MGMGGKEKERVLMTEAKVGSVKVGESAEATDIVGNVEALPINAESKITEIVSTQIQKDGPIFVAGGGSGGHLNAAVATLNYWKEKRPDMYQKVIYIGSERGMIGDSVKSLESRKVPELGIKFVAIRSGKLHRKFNLTTLKLLFGVVLGLFDSLKIVSVHKPAVIFSTGGYVTVPLIVAAALFRVPVVIHEQTIVAGLANKIASRFASKIMITFPDSAKYFPAHKVVLTGGPLQKSRFSSVLPENLEVNYREFLLRVKNEDRPFIFITGGGLGSHKINMWFLQNLNQLAEKYYILIQTGENKLFDDFSKIETEISKLNEKARKNVFAVQWFKDEIGYIYKNADLVIARPGANTVQELVALKKIAALIPIKWSSGNEQMLNARYFLKHNKGIILDEDNLEEELNLYLQEFK